MLRASLPSLLFFSTTSSSRLMTLRFMTASALLGLSTGILFSAHLLSSHLSTVNSVFLEINMLLCVWASPQAKFFTHFPLFCSVSSLHC
jgi:hypothetical protein